MRSLNIAVAASALSLVAALGLAVPAEAHVPSGPPPTRAEVVGPVLVTSATTAKVLAHYRCTGAPEDIHLWVSVKQAKDRKADPELALEGSSSTAVAWSQTHAGVPTCDSRWHYQWFRLDQQEQGFGKLKAGVVYVQFCLFDAFNTEAPVSDMTFHHALTLRHHHS